MKTKSSPIEIAKINYQKIESRCHSVPPNPVSFAKIRPAYSATIRILEFIKNNPNCTRAAVKNYYKIKFGRCISATTFQNLLWAKLITSRKYNLTKLGNEFLKYYTA